jgi:hypothetical protein
MPHLPFDASPKFKGKSQRGLYGDAVEELDDSTGQILDKLRALGLAEKTLVMFTSDNGPERKTPGTAAPLSGTKHTVYEGGLRVPCIARWPGRVPAGRVSDEFITTLDLLPAFARLAGTTPPKNLDGFDISPVLLGEKGARSPRTTLYSLYGYGKSRFESMREGRWKLHLGAPPMLYDLRNDLSETTDIAAQHPDVVQRLSRLAERTRISIGDNGRRPAGEAVRLSWRDESFEQTPGGVLHATGRREGWEVQQTGRNEIRDGLRAEVVDDAAGAKSGRKYLSLSIPRNTQGFEFVTVGQRVRLAPDADYEASVWVRWPDGPDAAPAGAGPTSRRRSAIVSFWARHRDGQGDFAGRDEWLFDNRWRRLNFRFRATDPEQPTFIYVSLLPNQNPAATTVIVDDFTLTASPGGAEKETRAGSLTQDADFSAQREGPITLPWHFVNMGGTGISGKIVNTSGNRFVTLAMDKNTSNFESAQVWQHVTLRQGARYEVSCRMRWNNFAADRPAPIVNFGIYHEATRTWYGPVDQTLEKTGEWRAYRFTHVPPHPGRWKLYVQLNGWGNFGRAVTVSCDDFKCLPAFPLGEGRRMETTK